MNGDIYLLALALGVKMSAHQCHLFQPNDVLPNCFSQEINSTLRPSLLHSCHHGLITDFHLTPQVSAGAWRTALDATRSIPPANPHPPTLPPQLGIMCSTSRTRTWITCSGSDSHAKGYMSWLNTLLSSSSSPSRNFNCVTRLGWECASLIPPLCFISPRRRFSHWRCKLGATEQLWNPSGREREWNSLVKINGGVRMDLSIGTLRCATAYVTFRSPKIHA